MSARTAAESAGWLAEWVLDRPVSAEAEAHAESVAEFLRGLVGPAATGRRSWCMGDSVKPCDGTDCMSPYVDIPATGGESVHADDGGIRFPFVSVYAETDQAGRPGVHVYVEGPIDCGDVRDAWATLTPAEARRYAAELLRHADLAECEQ
ncbi:hypothetical protein [Plantactinospora sp. WMMB782]|uniref:hypothetical protein n=1 Tax=Plantactinospora sp. WMMB782 TaxID=3404121 RepID=UPI003B93D766